MTIINTVTGQEYVHEPPFAIQIELVEGCNLRCAFCGLNGIRGKGDRAEKLASQQTLRAIAKGIADAGWGERLRVEFAMHGEPTLHPHLVQIVAMFRDYLPTTRIVLTSNGVPLTRVMPHTNSFVYETEEERFHANAAALFDAGLTVLAIDEYEGIVLPAVAARTFSHRGVKVYDYPDDIMGNPHRARASDDKTLSVVRNIAEQTKGTHSMLNNHAGAAGPRNENMQGRRCAKPFREMSFRWDGSVAICCNDWRGEYVVGNINEMPIQDIWGHERFSAVRKALYHGLRTTSPCAGCDARSYRLGLLPDRQGKAELEEPSEDDYRIMSEALADGPLSPPAWRPWETERRLPVIVAGETLEEALG